MFRQPGGWRDRIEAMAQRFREKGATSPERAMSAQELGLPPRFEEAMKRRLGQTGIFVEAGGKYYLNEARFKEASERQQGRMGYSQGGMHGFRRSMMTIRIVRMIMGVAIIIMVLVNFLYGRGTLSWYLIAALIVVWIAISVLQIYYLSRLRNRMRSRNATGSLGNQ
jgi:hypothetical protein